MQDPERAKASREQWESALKEIRELPLHKDTSVVMISSKDYAQDRSIANDLGALDFITKPMPIQAIRDVVIKHLNIDPAN